MSYGIILYFIWHANDEVSHIEVPSKKIWFYLLSNGDNQTGTTKEYL